MVDFFLMSCINLDLMLCLGDIMILFEYLLSKIFLFLSSVGVMFW